LPLGSRNESPSQSAAGGVYAHEADSHSVGR
jgi:hypothetical protein